MTVTSQKYEFDQRLLAVEELVRQRKFEELTREIAGFSPSEFKENSHQAGLLLSLRADAALFAGNYRTTIDCGLQATRILARFPLHRRYARALVVLSKGYSAIGDLKNAEIRARDAQAAFRRAADPDGQVGALNELARVAFIQSDYAAACRYVDEAIQLADNNAHKVAQLSGNAARIRILLGEWDTAEENLRSALEYNRGHNEEYSIAVNTLSLSYLHIKRREHHEAERALKETLGYIESLALKREKVIYLEYMGELSYDRGDIHKAKTTLSEAYHTGRLLAPHSSLISQSCRRLAEVELALDNINEAMKYAQKGLDIALQVGEKAEVAASRRVIARAFALQGEFKEALEYSGQAVEVAREVGDPCELGHTLLAMAEIRTIAEAAEPDKTDQCLSEAIRIFRRLKLTYWLAEAEFRAGVFSCSRGDLSRGFKKLSRAERLFVALSDNVNVRKVSGFLASLAEQAVALSVSEDNQFRAFGRVVNNSELEGLQSGRIEEILDLLVQKTSADRAIIIAPDLDMEQVMASFDMNGRQVMKFRESFTRLLNEEISIDRPTLMLDCRRDPYINGLFGDIPDVVASILVVPFTLADKTTSFIYLDRLTSDSTLNPFDQEALNFAVGFSEIVAFRFAEFQRQKLVEDNERLKAQLMESAAFPNIVTQNHEMIELLAQVRQVVNSPISITIEGPTGAGKDLLARAIHYNSDRRGKRFISVNCAALPETLLESELFGYRKGTFTGADRDKPGLFEEADGGTFFLDEIADMPLSVQAKILRVLEEKEIVRLGESIPRPVDVRVISATNKDLKEAMAAGQFRQDLYYRLAALTFKLPALSERREDIPLLVNHFLSHSGKTVDPTAMKHLVSYEWPGNVRELDNEVKKMILLAGEDNRITETILSDKLRGKVNGNGNGNGSNGHGHAVLSGHIPDPTEFTPQYTLYDYLAKHERRFIIQALREKKGIKKHAAAYLNIPESTLRLKIKEYSIDLDQLDAAH